MPSPRTISVNGIEMFALEQGTGPLVLLCHGWPELSYSWRHHMPAIADAGYDVVALDMRGYGQTTAPADIAAYHWVQQERAKEVNAALIAFLKESRS